MHMLRVKHFLLFAIFVGILAIFPLSTTGKIDLSRLFYFYPCDTPIVYRIDTIDPGFNLTLQDVRDTAQKAATLWNTVYGKSLFVYDPQSELSINLIFDARQQLTNEYRRLNDELKQKESMLNPQITEFRKRVNSFNERAKRLDEEITLWNSQGGAPPGEYERLINEQNSLNAEAQELNRISESLNQSTDVFNANVRNLNYAVDSLNKSLSEKPEEGIYNGATNRIEVYFNNNRQELIRTIAHEMGHARGLGHTGDPFSIMYPTTTAILTISQEDRLLLQKSCQKQSIVVLLQERFSIWMQSLQKPQ